MELEWHSWAREIRRLVTALTESRDGDARKTLKEKLDVAAAEFKRAYILAHRT
jgi:hypothetical protein